MDTEKRKRGRPKNIVETKPRMFGRWTDADWQTLDDAAKKTGDGNVAAFAKRVLLRAARRVLGKK